jgi:hypothetical protein
MPYQNTQESKGFLLQRQADYGEIVASVVNFRDFLNYLVCSGLFLERSNGWRHAKRGSQFGSRSLEIKSMPTRTNAQLNSNRHRVRSKQVEGRGPARQAKRRVQDLLKSSIKEDPVSSYYLDY